MYIKYVWPFLQVNLQLARFHFWSHNWLNELLLIIKITINNYNNNHYSVITMRVSQKSNWAIFGNFLIPLRRQYNQCSIFEKQLTYCICVSLFITKKAINNNKYQDTFIKVIFVRVILIGMLHLFYTFIYRIKISLKNKCTIYHNMHLYEFAKYWSKLNIQEVHSILHIAFISNILSS